MQNTLLTLIRDAGRLAFYSLVISPALMLYFLVMLAASDGSLSRQFLTAYQDLTEGAPAGKVMYCMSDKDWGIRIPQQDSGKKLKSVTVPREPDVLCQRSPVDSDLWARSTDSMLWNLWIMAAMFGCGSWFILRRLILIGQKRISSDKHSLLFLQKKENSNER
ncbi:TPA: hypothetical protein ACHF2V_004313 [Citrobacter farmeri]|uniref:hypothetical protein n=1 Tax=Citrobacter TaxID=544 RepID=UPI000E15017C|nr:MULTISPECIES: hypothetical protein [Citrobacter]EKQ0626968.1 hypothetical protein [Salmonella enterica]MDT7072810.1 hypothetical protein [Citrobacter amalonaticus]MEC3934072.1 hypothetical protein [Citrobacter farmeri]UBI23184.1 hypothetical protein LA348_23835 [Citrobacter amalonaticus]STA62757.1 Uncharacterised protein [Citrobacter amalonaticus]